MMAAPPPLSSSSQSFPSPSSSSSSSSPSPFSSSPLVLKVRNVSNGDCRRFPLPVSPPLSFPALLSCVSSLFSLSASRVLLQWCDDEGDMVTVASEAEWQGLQRGAREKEQRVLQLSVVDDGTTLRDQPQQPQQQQLPPNTQSPSADSAVDAAHASPPHSAWQNDVHSILGQQSMAAPLSFPYPSLFQSSQQQCELNAQREQKDTTIERQTYQQSSYPQQPSQPCQPSQLQQPNQLSVASHSSAVVSPVVSSDEESPVLIDGFNLPSAEDSHAASALWKRHKYKTQQSLIQRRSSQSSTQLTRPALPTAPPVPLTLSLNAARSTAAFKSVHKSQPQLSAPATSSLSLPSSPLSRSPPSSRPSSSPVQNAFSQHLERARLQLKHLLPTSLTSSSLPCSSTGGRSASKLSASIASEQEVNERIAAAYELLTSFIAVDGSREDDEPVSRDEILSRCIALFVYDEKYLSDKKQRNDLLATQLGGVQMNRREEEEVEAAMRRQLLSEAQRHGLRSLSSSVPISASCSPALVTVMAIIHRYLQSRVVTDVPATLELFAAVLADLTAQVQREENRETALKQMQHSRQAEQEEVKESMSLPSAGSHSDVPSDMELLASLSRLPAPLCDSVRSLFSNCVYYAEAAVAANPDVAFSSLSSHSFAATLHAFRTDLYDLANDDILREQHDRTMQQADSSQAQQQSDSDAVDSASHQPVQPLSPHQLQQSHAGDVHSLSELSEQAALFDVGRGDVMLSDRKIMKAVAKAIKKEQKEQRKANKAEEKRRRKASRGKSIVSAALQQPVADEERELHELLSQMNNTRQQQHSSSIVGSEAMADGDGWQLYPQPLASPVESADAYSPFAYQPFPYTLHNKQQQQQEDRTEQVDRPPVAVSSPQLAAAAVPIPRLSQPTLPSDVTHFPSLPFAAASPASIAHSTTPLLSPSPPSAAAPSVPQPSFASVVCSNPQSVGQSSSVTSSGAVDSRRLSSLFASLSVMGFTDQSLNRWLLERNGYDLNQTVEWLIVQSEVGLD